MINKIKKIAKNVLMFGFIMFLAICVQFTTSTMVDVLISKYQTNQETKRMEEVANFYRSYNQNHPIEYVAGDEIIETTKKQ